jgi:REP element-mobilizing transposase RayT
MPRKPRIHFPGAVYHVILRGNAGDPIFFEDRDRLRLYLYLQHATEKFNCRIHGFCLMTNHIHLIMQVADTPLARIMQSVTLRYTKWINYTQGRTGHVFQGRYKALLLDADVYLLELVRYVHLNPVRAGIVAAAHEHPWSGHRAYAGLEVLPWLATDWVMSLFSEKAGAARRAYQAFVAEGVGGNKRVDFHNGNCEGLLLGGDAFADEALRSAEQQRRREFTLADVVDAVCRCYGIAAPQLKSPGKLRPYTEARALATMFVHESSHLSLTELGKFLNRNIAPLGRAAQLLAKRAATDSVLAERIGDVRRELEMAESQT